MQTRRAFTLIEFFVVAALLALVACLMLPLRARSAQPGGLEVSLNNVRQIIAAQASYRMDSADLIPMRGAQYSTGQLGGWDTWCFGGKNAYLSWSGQSNGMFDEPAFCRPGFRRPPGYYSNGSGATWSFGHGTPTQSDRDNVQLPVFRSPGDVGSLSSCSASSLSSYHDVGTSYVLNMKWWDQQGLPPQFTPRYDAGVNRIRALTSTPWVETYVWVHDTVADRVASCGSATQHFPGEFGGEDISVCGFLDGRAEYTQLVPGALSGPGYTFLLPPPPGPPPPPGAPRPRPSEPFAGFMVNPEQAAPADRR